MAISSLITKHIYDGNDLTTHWPYTFSISTDDGSDIKVYITTPAGVTTEITTGFEVDVDAEEVIYPILTDPVTAPLPTGYKITLLRTEDLTQLVDLITQGAFNAEVVEAALDKLTMINQQLKEEISRCPKYPVDETPTSEETDEFINTITTLKTAAETAKTAAQLAQSLAETARNAAQAAQSSAETAETNAETAETNAQTAQAAAEAAQTAAETAETNAQTAQAAAEAARDLAAAYAASAAGIPIATAGGTVDAITADYTPDISLLNLTLCAFVAIGANTSTTPTFAPDGLTAHTITKKGGSALVAGDIPAAGFVAILEYNLTNTRWELLNPALAAVPALDGVKFPATQVPSADANTLDDYEEGIWTAAFTATSGTITLSAGDRTGAYTKIGRKVTLTGYFYVDSVSSPTGTLTITGLPFACASGDQFYSVCPVYGNGMDAPATTSLIGFIATGASSIVIKDFTAGATGNVGADVNASTDYIISITYFTT